MQFIADLHIHSRYSRATSRDCTPEMLEVWARKKGLGLIGTGDFTHPAWREELAEKLSPAEEGVFILRKEYRRPGTAVCRQISSDTGKDFTAFDESACQPRFLLSTEISSIYKKGDKVRKVHNVILLPSFTAAESLSKKLESIGNLHSDGRPILGLDSRDLLEITLNICPEAMFIPAHIWTPHFSLFGAYSGFDTIEDCFGDLTEYITALETGLSSDPGMNWRVSALDRFQLISNSDAHSPAKLAREANLFQTDRNYASIRTALEDKASDAFQGTLEFYPEEGKYHMDGHRRCKCCLTPAETIAAGGKCPECGKRITVGVLHRIETLADRAEGYRPANAKDYHHIIPLPEVIGGSLGLGVSSKKTQALYEKMLCGLGAELPILREIPLEEISALAGPCVAEGIRRVRSGQVQWQPGYDGEYGAVTILDESARNYFAGQMSMFPVGSLPKEAKDRKHKAVKRPAVKGSALPDYEVAPMMNRAQREAVHSCGGTIAVIAGPGTGKTYTLIEHIRYLIEEQQVDPNEITAVTFTNKAAGELRERLNKRLTNKRTARAVHIGTFHSICLALLQDLQEQRTLLAPYDALAIADVVKKELEMSETPKTILQAISARKNGLETAEILPEEAYRRYTEKLEQYQAMDFDDLIVSVWKSFSQCGQALDALRKQFQYLLVDEFQDINPAQLALILQWSVQNRELFVIGDPDQAIYGFRGSDPRCFERLKERSVHYRQIALTENYRSAPEILQCAEQIIKKLPESAAGGSRVLRPRSSAEGSVRQLAADSAFSEAIFLAKEINRLVGGIDMLDAHQQTSEENDVLCSFSDIAVLYRTHRQAAVLEECLRKEGIPYIVSGRDRFLEKEEVRKAICFFSSVVFPGHQIAAAHSENLLGKEAYVRLKHLFSPERLKRESASDLLVSWMAETNEKATDSLRKLCEMAVCYPTLPELLQNLILGEEIDVRRYGGKQYQSNAVTITTLHGAKGLEFPVVFICGVSDGILPLRLAEKPVELDEERRLFYVGMTRAKKQLFLLTSSTPSSFLRDIPANMLQKGVVWNASQETAKQISLF